MPIEVAAPPGRAASDAGASAWPAPHAPHVPDAGLEATVTTIVDLYRQAGRAMRSGDPADWGANVTMPQFRVLFFLGRAGPASVGEVAAAVGVSQPSATETLDKLVRAGFVARAPDAHDRRVVRNALTPAGRAEIDRPWQARRAVLASALRAAPPDDRAAIEHGLRRLCDALARTGGTANLANPANSTRPPDAGHTGESPGNVAE
jgi:DNA-binding MarR family transcriptional regulator